MTHELILPNAQHQIVIPNFVRHSKKLIYGTLFLFEVFGNLYGWEENHIQILVSSMKGKVVLRLSQTQS